MVLLFSVHRTFIEHALAKSIKGPKCLNCDKLLHGENYCPQCGQKNDQRKENILEYIRSSLSYLLGADSRLITTLKPLITQPGLLPQDYNMGKKSRFVPPLRLFIWLFLSILIVQKMSSWTATEEEYNAPLIQIGELGEDTTSSQVNLENDTLSKIANYALQHPNESETQGLKALELPPSFGNRMVYRFFHRLAEANQSSILKSFLDHLLMMLLLFTPFFALWLKLIYLRHRSLFLLDHMVFILYNHALLFLLLLLAMLSEWAIEWNSFGFVLLLYGFYLWKAFKRFYGQSTWRRLFKFSLAGLGFMGMAILLFIINSLAAILLN